MSRLAPPPTNHEATWSSRNQAWLSARFGHWRERLDKGLSSDNESGDDPLALHSDDLRPAALHLQALFGLSAFETELLIVAAGVEIDAGLAAAVARAQGTSPGQPVRLDFSLALAVLPRPHWDALSPVGPLRDWSLITVDAEAGFMHARLRIEERILHYLTSVPAVDDQLVGLARFDHEDAGSHPEFASQIVKTVGEVREPLVMLAGATLDPARMRVGRRLARSTFARMGLRTLWLDFGAIHADARELVDIARRLDREAALTSSAIAFALEGDSSQHARAVRLIAALRGPVIVLNTLSAGQLADLPGRPTFRFNVPSPEPAAREAWPARLRLAADRALQQFRVEPSVVEQALASVAGIDDEDAIEQAVWDALRESARGGLDALAQRIESRATLDDLVVPPLVSAQLREIVGQLRHRQTVYDEWGLGERHSRGFGMAALFVGESGTGKTLAAEVVANEARLDLYRIDLASVVSKYIGETEKNLSRVFDAAERSGAVLLFDEADALFGKRSEVRDSHDRYANIELAYLLQRIESYRGLAILTTNLRSALDRAFLRRIRFVVHFPFPDPAARLELWRRQFPARAPLGEVDFQALARLQLAGGHIRLVALNAAFRAAARGEAIGQAALQAAARAEFAKLERTVNDAAVGRPAGARGAP